MDIVILGVDTSSTDLSVCLCKDGAPVSNVCRYIHNSHAEHITQAVKFTLELGGISAQEVTHLAVSVGPGSFTGLRIGLSFVKGLCMMTERKILPLSSLMVLAHAVTSNSAANRKIFTALDARQGRIHWASFICGDSDTNNTYITNNLRRLTDDRLSPPEELLNTLSPDDLIVTDTVGYSRSTIFNRFDGRAEIICAEKSALSRGHSCAAIAYHNRDNSALWRSAQVIVPNYLQMSAAQEKAAVC